MKESGTHSTEFMIFYFQKIFSYSTWFDFISKFFEQVLDIKKVHLFVEKAVQNQILDWMTKTIFRTISWVAKKQFLGVKKQLLDAKNQLLATKKLVLGNSTGWSKDSFGHPIQKLVLDRFWMTFFYEEMYLLVWILKGSSWCLAPGQANGLLDPP